MWLEQNLQWETKKKYTGNIYFSAERKQGDRADKRQTENERRQRNVAVEPGNPNTQRLQ